MADENDQKEPKKSARDALQWMRDRNSDEVLFRGQTRVYPTIYPSLLRNNVSEEDRWQWWRVTQRFISSRHGVTGYSITSPHDALAMVQHYLLKSPVLDLSGTPEIALYFALMDPYRAPPCVVYSANTSALRAAGLIVTDHTFLALPLDGGGMKHRWLRQDGYTVGVDPWSDLNAARKLDFAGLPGVESFTFHRRPGDESLVSNLGDLETVDGDFLAAAVRSVFESVADAMDCLEVVRRLMAGTSTIDARQRLIVEIESLIARARVLGRSAKDMAALKELRVAAESRYWDMSWDAALDYWTRELTN